MALVEAHNSHDTVPVFDSKETLKAAHALVRHLEKHRDDKIVDKPSLLEDDDEENVNSKLDVPLWLIINAKERIATSHSLNPGKVVVPHPLYSSAQTRICLITADPPTTDSKAYKNLVKHVTFPRDLKEKIVKVIAYSRLAKKHKSFESRRLLMAEFDLFLADERVVRLLPAALGSTFYKSTTKRPIPVSLIGKEAWGKKQKKTPLERLKSKKKTPPLVIGKPDDVAQDIEKAMSTLAVHLSPSMTTSIKVAYAGWPAEWIAENVDAAVNRVVAKYVPNQWNGVKSIHLKGPQTAALPIWMADEVWQDETRVLDEGEAPVSTEFRKKTKEEKRQRKETAKRNALELKDAVYETPKKVSKKRKLTDGEDAPQKKSKKGKTVTIAEASMTGANEQVIGQFEEQQNNLANEREADEVEVARPAKRKRSGKNPVKESMQQKAVETSEKRKHTVPREEAKSSKRAKKEKREKNSKTEQPELVEVSKTKPSQGESRLNFDVSNWQWTTKS